MKPISKLPHFYLLKIFKNQDMLKVKFLEINNKINMRVPYFFSTEQKNKIKKRYQQVQMSPLTLG